MVLCSARGTTRPTAPTTAIATASEGGPNGPVMPSLMGPAANSDACTVHDRHNVSGPHESRHSRRHPRRGPSDTRSVSPSKQQDGNDDGQGKGVSPLPDRSGHRIGPELKHELDSQPHNVETNEPRPPTRGEPPSPARACAHHSTSGRPEHHAWWREASTSQGLRPSGTARELCSAVCFRPHLCKGSRVPEFAGRRHVVPGESDPTACGRKNGPDDQVPSVSPPGVGPARSAEISADDKQVDRQPFRAEHPREG